MVTGTKPEPSAEAASVLSHRAIFQYAPAAEPEEARSPPSAGRLGCGSVCPGAQEPLRVEALPTPLLWGWSPQNSTFLFFVLLVIIMCVHTCGHTCACPCLHICQHMPVAVRRQFLGAASLLCQGCPGGQIKVVKLGSQLCHSVNYLPHGPLSF